MKHTLKLLTAILLSPLATLHAAPSPDSHIIIASEAGAKLDSDVTKGGGTEDTALIQSILDRAPKLGSLKLVVDGAILVKGLKVHSSTTIECLNRACGFYLADNSNRPLIANATPQPEGRADRNLSFLGGTYNGNADCLRVARRGSGVVSGCLDHQLAHLCGVSHELAACSL
jgi:hypothetical protein